MSLNFKSINSAASRTVLLIHGGLTSLHEWDLVCQTPHLSAYHLLIPDLPGHGHSTSATIPFNIPDTAALLADLIAKHAKNGKADIAGMSLGAFTAIYIANKYPEIINDSGMFLSGAAMDWGKPGTWKVWLYGVMGGVSGWVVTRFPESVWMWILAMIGLQGSSALYKDMRACAGLKLGRAMMDSLSSTGNEGSWKELCEGVKVRTCIVAGALEDPVPENAERGKQLRKGNSASKAFKVEGMKHAWDFQDPDLFARGIKSWLDDDALPEEYIELD